MLRLCLNCLVTDTYGNTLPVMNFFFLRGYFSWSEMMNNLFSFSVNFWSFQVTNSNNSIKFPWNQNRLQIRNFSLCCIMQSKNSLARSQP